MVKKKWQNGLTDLSLGQEYDSIIEVVKPDHGFDKQTLRGTVWDIALNVFTDIYRRVLTFSRMEHLGTLRMIARGDPHIYGAEIEMLSIMPCGGRFRIQEPLNKTDLAAYYCPKCELMIGAKPGCGEIQPMVEDHMFQLMLKQMCPDLDDTGASYIDCAAYAGHSEEARAVQELGLISVSRFFLSFIKERRDLLSPAEWFPVDLGFTLMPGMETRKICDGFDGWLRFLVGKKMERDKEILRDLYTQSRARILGPKAPK